MSRALRIAVPLLLAVSVVAGLGVYMRASLIDAVVSLQQPRPPPLTADAKENGTDSSSESEDVTYGKLRTGDAHALAGEWKLAEQAYRDAVSADGGAPALRKLAFAQLQLRAFDDARSTVDRLRREGGRAEDIFLLQASIALHQGDSSAVEGLLAAAPDTPQKHYVGALAAIVRGDHDTAKTELAVVADGWDPVLRGYARTLRGAYEEFSLFPASTQIHLDTLLSRALAQAQECGLALPLLDRVTRQQDDYRDAWIVQGYCQLMNGSTQQALTSLERAYTLDPQKPEVQYFLGRAYAARADHTNAITFYRYALENGFQPERDVRRALAKEAQASGDLQLAFDQERILATSSGSTLESYASFVELALKAGRKDDALSAAKNATTRWPDSVRAFDLFGSTAATLGKKDDARAAFEKALQIDGGRDDIKKKLLSL